MTMLPNLVVDGELCAELVSFTVLVLFELVLVIIWLAQKLFVRTAEQKRLSAAQVAILRAVQDGVIGIGPDGKVQFFNSHADAFLGDVIVPGCPLPQSAPGSTELLAHVSLLCGERGIAEGTRTVRIDENGKERHFSLSISSFRAGRGAARDGLAYVLTIRDVTAEAEAARHSAECEARIAEASRVMSYAVITGSIVHEISQPLSAMRNYLHILKTAAKTRQIPARHRLIINYLGEEADRLTEIIRNVRQMGPHEERADGNCRLTDAVEQSLRLLSLGANPPPAITVKTVVNEDLRVRGSVALMGQVIINLVKNALQASASANAKGAEIILRKSGGYAEIAVADNGPGIGADAAAGLFVPFTRSSGGGMGLGLAICQRIARNLGGDVSWENRESGGALFKFAVPLAAGG